MITIYICHDGKHKACLTSGKFVKLTDRSFYRVIKLWETGKIKVSQQKVMYLGLKTIFERVG